MSTFGVICRLDGTYNQTANLGQRIWTFARSNGSLTLGDGVASLQADRMYGTPEGGQVIATGTNFDIDLSGSVPDAVALNMVFVKVKVVRIYAYDTNTGNLTYGNGTNPWQGWLSAAANTFTIPPGGLVMHTNLIAGWSVTGGVADVIRLNNATGSDAKVDVEIIGTSA